MSDLDQDKSSDSKWFIPVIQGFSFVLGLAIILAGVGYTLWNSKPEEEQQSTSEVIAVQIKGAVQSPGVYRLSSSSRLADLVIAAGGLSADADDSDLNLALKLRDEEVVDIPRRISVGNSSPELSPSSQRDLVDPQSMNSEVRPQPPLEVKPEGHSGTSESRGQDEVHWQGGPLTKAERTPIDLNQANSEELEQLPGIGPKLARKILEYRSSLPYGRFGATEDLLNVKGIKKKKYEAIAPLVMVSLGRVHDGNNRRYFSEAS